MHDQLVLASRPEHQLTFCQLVIGVPRLPLGDLAVLNPKLSIVRMHSSLNLVASNGTGLSKSVDDDLPSVMTSANYLRLPSLSTNF